MAGTGLFAELKRRHVWRVAIAYAVAGWLIVQIATQVFPFFNIPNWGVRLVVILVVIGFPVVVILAWVYEITPEGVRRTVSADSPDARAEHAISQIGRKLNAVIVVVLILAVALMGWRLLTLRHGETTPGRSPDVGQRLRLQGMQTRTAEPARRVSDRDVANQSGTDIPPDSAAGASASGLHAATAAFNPPADSIVVLPFANLSGDPKQAYFSDGITEELTNALGQNTGLTVIAWDTASKYAHSKLTPKQIGKALNVAHVLAGSIQREGDAVRVTTELVNTADGRQLWSAHYDDSLKNIFAVQDKVSAAIAGALQVKFAGMQAAPTTNPQAHELYLKGMSALNLTTAADAQVAQNYFQQALKLDPNYADAWSGLSATWLQLTLISTLPAKEALPKIRATAQKALALDPHNVHALLELGNADALDHHTGRAKAEYRQALALDPSNANAHVLYATVLPLKQALAQTQEGAMLDPKSVLGQMNLAWIYQEVGDWPRMAAAAQAVIPLSPHVIYAAFDLSFAYTQMQRGEEAVKAFDLVHPATAEDKQLVDAGQLTYQALLQPSLRPKALAALSKLRRTQTSHNAQHILLQLYLALGAKTTAMQILPSFCAASPVGCGDLAVSPSYAPLRGDPRFEKLAKQYTTITLDSAPASAASR